MCSSAGVQTHAMVGEVDMVCWSWSITCCDRWMLLLCPMFTDSETTAGGCVVVSIAEGTHTHTHTLCLEITTLESFYFLYPVSKGMHVLLD